VIPLYSEEELREREAKLASRLARIEEMEAQAARREKAVLLRLSPSLWDEVASWAEEDFRSINAQIEFLLTEAVRQRRRKGS